MNCLTDECSNLIADIRILLDALKAARRENAPGDDSVVPVVQIEELLGRFQEAATTPVDRDARHAFSNLLVALSLHARKLRQAFEPGDSVHSAAVSIDNRTKELIRLLRKSDGDREEQVWHATANGVPNGDIVSAGKKIDTSRNALVGKLKGSRCKILLVDDEDIVREVVEEMLQSMGHEVVCAQDGQEAIDYFEANMRNIDLILLDLTMPVMNGWHCFRKLKGIDPAVKVMLATGHDFDHVAQEMMEEGVAGFVQKPYSMAELSAALVEALSYRVGSADAPEETAK